MSSFLPAWAKSCGGKGVGLGWCLCWVMGMEPGWKRMLREAVGPLSCPAQSILLSELVLSLRAAWTRLGITQLGHSQRETRFKWHRRNSGRFFPAKLHAFRRAWNGC